MRTSVHYLMLPLVLGALASCGETTTFKNGAVGNTAPGATQSEKKKVSPQDNGDATIDPNAMTQASGSANPAENATSNAANTVLAAVTANDPGTNGATADANASGQPGVDSAQNNPADPNSAGNSQPTTGGGNNTGSQPVAGGSSSGSGSGNDTGGQQVAGGSGSGSNSQPTPAVSPSPTPAVALNTVNWNWPCPMTSGPDAQFNIFGQGIHAVPRSQVGSITFSGTVCPPAPFERDVIFVVDVSGSMGPQPSYDTQDPSIWDHDPLVNQSCGRLNAVQQLINGFASQNNVQFGLVTFSSSIVASSQVLSTSNSAFTQDLQSHNSGASLASIICAANGGTNYNAALQGAQNLLNLDSRTNVIKEIYFISDGEPNEGDGIAIANTLKSQGATIATIMLIGDDAGLQAIASTAPSGQLLDTKVENATQLAPTLEDMALNPIAGATIQYRSIGASTWTSVNLIPSLQNLEFQLSPIALDFAQGAAGVEVNYAYWDRAGNQSNFSGTLNLQ